MDKTQALKLLLEISDECKNAKRCNKCCFYNLVEHIEGCVFDELAVQYTPSDFRETLGKK